MSWIRSIVAALGLGASAVSLGLPWRSDTLGRLTGGLDVTTTRLDLNPYWSHANDAFTTQVGAGLTAAIQAVLVVALLAQAFAFGALGYFDRLATRAAALAVLAAHAGLLAWHIQADAAGTCIDAWSHGAASTCTTRAGAGTALMLSGPMLTLVAVALQDSRHHEPPPLPPL